MAEAIGWQVFPTALGECAVAWSTAGIAGAWLPGSTSEALRAHLKRRHPQAREGAPPALAEAAVAGITALLAGERRDLRELVLDWDDAPAFERRVWAFTRGIGPGETTTYGELARAIGEPGAARAVGRALGRNPFAPIVPCHRVLAAGGAAGGFSAPGGTRTKLAMLEIERARFGGEPSLFD